VPKEQTKDENKDSEGQQEKEKKPEADLQKDQFTVLVLTVMSLVHLAV
jgi:hypothetical protein